MILRLIFGILFIIVFISVNTTEGYLLLPTTTVLFSIRSINTLSNNDRLSKRINSFSSYSSSSSSSSSSSEDTTIIDDNNKLYGDNNNSNDNTVVLLQQQRMKLHLQLENIERLQESIEWSQDVEALKSLEEQIEQLEIKNYMTSFPIPPKDCTISEYYNGIQSFIKLPLFIRMIYYETIQDIKQQQTNDDNNNERDIDDTFQSAIDFDKIPEIVSDIYKYQDQLTPARIQNSISIIKSSNIKIQRGDPKLQQKQQDNSNKQKTNKSNSKSSNSIIFDISNSDNLSIDEIQNQQTIDTMLPKVTRIKDRTITDNELQIVKTALKTNRQDLFIIQDIEEIIGGYIIRGENKYLLKNKNATEIDFINELDKCLPNNFNGQLCYIPDFSDRGVERFAEENDGGDGELKPVLFLFNKDMSPTTNKYLILFTSLCALLTSFLFSFGVYGGNDTIVNLITNLDPNDPNSYDILNTFNIKILQVLLPIYAIQLSHEIGHWIGNNDNNSIKTTNVPILLPFWQLPWLSSITRLTRSPSNLTTLFDYAICGPIFGLVTSIILLWFGLQETATATADAIQYYPALPVSVLKISTFGSTIIDYIVNGGTSGFLISQDPSTPVPLHPWAIAGYTGLIIQALELLPLGATDGGRLSLSMFGRIGHNIVGGAIWTILLITCLFVPNTEVLLTAWIIYNFVQYDQEVPAREEVNKVNLTRCTAAFSLWFLAVLILAPVTV